MQRTKLVVIGLVISLSAAFGVATISQASGVQTGDRVHVAEDAVHAGSLYAAGDRIIVDGTVEGDLYCAGRELILNGAVEGDVLCAVQSATINGSVGQDIRLAGQYANINSEVTGSVTFFGQDIKLFSEGSIAGDLNGAAQHIMLSGPVGRSVFIGGQKLTLQSTVGGNIDAAIESVDIMSGAEVAGDFNYHADRKLSIDESVVGGSVSYTPANQNRSGGLAFVLLMLVSIAVSALIIIMLAPRFVERSFGKVSTSALIVGLAGFAVLFGVPMLAIFLMVSLMFMPIGLLLLGLWLAAVVASQALFAYLLGSVALRQQSNILVRGFAGVALLLALYLIPVINFFAVIASLVFGVGMAVTTMLDGYRRPDYSLDSASRPKAKKS